MELWTEYEGTTIDGSFPLTKLLRPEGRSAFFSTSNGNGVPRLIRLIESHFDDEEILARWRGVAALNHPHLLKLEKYGQVELDATSLVYAVMEPVDANLADVVSRQRLTVAETRQLAISLAAALEALHAHGFVHEHVEPASVLAVGEVVKLRSDCIREAPEGEEGRSLKKRDVRDLAVVLLQALTQERMLDASTSNLLPAPFNEIVPKAMSGEWGLADIDAALTEAPPKSALPAAASATKPPVPVEFTPAAAVQELQKNRAPAASERSSVPEDVHTRSGRFSSGWIAAAALLVIVVLWLGWYLLRPRPAAQSPTPQQTSTGAQIEQSIAAPAAAASAAAKAGGPAGDQWRVIAFTYNQQAQAQHKAATIAQNHPDLRPEVLAPSGHAPYLVTVGGAMSRDAAFALVKKVRGEGLPADSYAQNYSGKRR